MPHVRALRYLRHGLLRLRSRLDQALLPIVASSPWLARAYYLLFSAAFAREQQATLAGRLHHARHEASGKVAAVIVRRNIHRLEKGLSMANARQVFALDYIDETLRAFENLLNSDRSGDTVLLHYAHDVLTTYFGVTVWSSSATQPQWFARLSAQTYAVLQPGFRPPARPAPHAELPDMDIRYEQFLALVRRRASVRHFEQRAVPRDLIEHAVAAAAQAPSACNRHSLRYIAVADGPLKAQLARLPMGTAGYADGIPVLLAVIGDLSAYPYERDRHVIYIDASLANMQLMLALETLGLSSCAINWPEMEDRERQVTRLLDLDLFERVVMLIAVGYAQPAGLVPHSEKKGVDQMLDWM